MGRALLVGVERRDLNGRPQERGRWARLRDRVAGRAEDAPLEVVEDGLIVVAESVDEAAASSTVLDASRWRAEEEVVVRHVLVLPAARGAEAIATAGLDEYRAVDSTTYPLTGAVAEPDRTTVVLARVQLLDAMHLSQERSRMASLGSRHGGAAIGWQVLQRPG
ncbi:hypothetical protein AAFP30_03455 [Gordonia sp. CPCC 205515]|uniref:hypothetical protein n=1 Tax=Gordonia sp. CPCC 205515 TaxID=3140791 RepID=UPI003AF3C4CD